VQLRDGSRDDDTLEPLAKRLRQVTASFDALLVINRRPLLARRVNADGVHAEATATDAIMSAPAHSDDDVRAARAARARFVLVSPIYQTPGKQPPRGVRALTDARAIAGEVGVIALGGVDEHNAAACFLAGAHGVACIRALLEAADPAHTARRLLGVGS
jgi:thiamine-phosphate pyrophosphorylase